MDHDCLSAGGNARQFSLTMTTAVMVKCDGLGGVTARDPTQRGLPFAELGAGDLKEACAECGFHSS